jgi:hypothetical protein
LLIILGKTGILRFFGASLDGRASRMMVQAWDAFPLLKHVHLFCIAKQIFKPRSAEL